MTGRQERDIHPVHAGLLAVSYCLALACILSEPASHDGECSRRRQHSAVTRTRVVCMPVRDQCPACWANRVDQEISGRAIEPIRRDAQPLFRTRARDLHGSPFPGYYTFGHCPMLSRPAGLAALMNTSIT